MRTNIYLSEDDYKIFKEVKAILKQLNKNRNLRLSISYLIALFIRKLHDQLEKAIITKDIYSLTSLDLNLGSININVNSIDIQDVPRGSQEVNLDYLFLKSNVKEWQRRLKFLEANMKIMKQRDVQKRVNDLKKEITNVIKRFKKAPKHLADEIALILTKLDNYSKIPIQRGDDLVYV